MIQLDNVTKTFRVAGVDVPVLRHVDLKIAAGEMVAVVGQSGSGKSTLMNLLGLLDHPTSGRYSIEGQAVEELDERGRTELRSRTFGFVFQAFHLIERRSVRANIEVGLIHSHVPRRLRSEAVDTAMQQVGLGHRADFSTSTLSGGEKQRVAVARAIAGSKQVLLCDEPTGNLDSSTSQSIIDLLLDLNRKGLTVIVVTHDQSLAKQCNRVVTMQDGVLVPENRTQLSGLS